MDIRSRILAARLSVRINHDKQYCGSIGIQDRSGFKAEKQEKLLKKEEHR